MVEVNDLAFRMMVRAHGVPLCFSGMINTHMWAVLPSGRAKQFETCDEDRPLIVQLNGHDEDELVACATELAAHADAFDINLGCTQHIARRGKFGYFMVNTEEKRSDSIQLIENLVRRAGVPITAKIRILQDERGMPSSEVTIDFAKRLEAAGVSMISVHGRHQSLDKAGDVNGALIRQIVASVSIPVLANGGICSMKDSDALLEATGAAGTMIGQGLLVNPRMFDPAAGFEVVSIGKEYLQLYRKYSGDRLIAKRHLFNFLVNDIRANPEIAAKLTEQWEVDDMEKFLDSYDGMFGANASV